MKHIKAIIKPEMLDIVKEALKNAGCSGIMVTEIEGHGRQGGIEQHWRGEKYELDLLPKISIDVIVKDEDEDNVINTILSNAKSGGEKGEGKIFVYNVERVIRVRTNEENESAI